MKVSIQPVRKIKNRWFHCTQDKAQAYELHSRGSMITRVNKLSEAEELQSRLEKNQKPTRQYRRREDLAGKRWSDVKDLL